MFCRNCGATLSDTAKFCRNCGATVVRAGAGDVAAQGTASMSPQLTPQSSGAIIKKLPSTLWQKECPLLIAGGHFATKNGNGEIVLNLEIQNNTEETIEAIFFDILGYNVLREEKCDLKMVGILDICVKPAAKAMIKPIDLPDDSIRQVTITVRNIVYANDTAWEYDGEEVCEPIELKQETISIEQAVQHYKVQLIRENLQNKNSASTFPYFPVFEKDYWLCACGQFNHADKCCKCKEEKRVIQLFFEKDTFLANYEVFREEEEKKEEEKRAQEEERQRQLAIQREEEEQKRRLELQQMQLAAEQERARKEEERRQRQEQIKESAVSFLNRIGEKTTAVGGKLKQQLESVASRKSDNGASGLAAAEEKRFCSNCGAELEPWAVFCQECGQAIERK